MLAWRGFGSLTASLINSKLSFCTEPASSKEVDLSACASLLRLYTSTQALSSGRLVHDCINQGALECQLLLQPLLLQFYLNCGALPDALHWFEHILTRDVLCWNLVIGALAKNGCNSDAFQTFARMRSKGVSPDKFTFIHLLSACPSLEETSHVYASIRMGGFESDIFVGTALVNTFGKHGSLEGARNTFERVAARNVVTWNAMITAVACNNHGKEALQLFNQMQQEATLADKATFVTLLSAYAGYATAYQCKQFHVHVISCGLEFDNVVVTALVCMYGKCCCISDARSLFDQMQKKSVISWNVLIALYTQHGHLDGSFQVFHQMQQEGVISDNVTLISLLDIGSSQLTLRHAKQIHLKAICGNGISDPVLATALLTGYAKQGALDAARWIFDRMPGRNEITWNAMIAAYAQCDCGIEALKLFDQMQAEGLIPNKVTLLVLICVCASQLALEKGKMVHSCVMHTDFKLENVIGSALISMYAKCGNLHDVEMVFDKVHQQNLSSWNAVMGAYAQHGDGKKVVQLFGMMQQKCVTADDITFVSILTSCSHAGMVDEGHYFLASMMKGHDIIPTVEHYDCIIDLLCRAGLIDEAEDFIHTLPCKPTVLSWTSLLAASRSQPDMERGKHAAKEWLNLDSTATAPAIILSALCDAMERKEEMLG